MRLFRTCYTLNNGHEGELWVSAASWLDALEVVWSTLGHVRRCSVRPV